MRPYSELLKEPHDMTDEEKARLENIKHIPRCVRNMIALELAKLNNSKCNLEEVLESYNEDEHTYPISEYRRDYEAVCNRIKELDDFVNGVWKC